MESIACSHVLEIKLAVRCGGLVVALLEAVYIVLV